MIGIFHNKFLPLGDNDFIKSLFEIVETKSLFLGNSISTNYPAMPIVKFTYALKRFFPDLADTRVNSASLPDLLDSIDTQYPGLKSYILDEQGMLRKHVNIFIEGELIRDREGLSDAFQKDSEVVIMQALSGG
jgi:sulfur-carrier protein